MTIKHDIASDNGHKKRHKIARFIGESGGVRARDGMGADVRFSRDAASRIDGDLRRLLVGTIGGFVLFGGLLLTIYVMLEDRVDARADKIENRVATLETKVDKDFNMLNDKMDSKFDAVDAKFGAVNARIDAMNARMDAKFDAVNEKLDQLISHKR